MCTNIAAKTAVTGSAMTARGWISVSEATMSFDHATHVWTEHALRMDFVGTSDADRMAVELDLKSARALLERLGEVVDAAERSGVS